MPFFFILSGMVFNNQKEFWHFVKARLNRLMIPYLVFSFISFLKHLPPDSVQSVTNMFLSWTTGLIEGVGSEPWTLENIPLWFLPCMFQASLMFYAISRTGKKTSMICSMLSMMIGMVLPHFGFVLPAHLDISMVAVGFLATGFYLKNYAKKLENLPAYLVCMALIVFISGALSNSQLDLFYRQYTNHVPLMLLTVLAGSFFLMGLARSLESQHWLAMLGAKSLGILCLHALAFALITKLCSRFEMVLYVPAILSVLKPVIYTVGGLIISLIALKGYDYIANWLLIGIKAKSERFASS